MREMHNETINSKIIEDVKENIKFVEAPNLANYDYITYSYGFIEIYKEPIYKQDSDGSYYMHKDEVRRQFKKDSISGVYVEV